MSRARFAWLLLCMLLVHEVHRVCAAPRPVATLPKGYAREHTGFAGVRRQHTMGAARVLLDDSPRDADTRAVADIVDYVITDAHLDVTRSGTSASTNLTVTMAVLLRGNAYGRVVRFRVTDANNRTAVLQVRVMPTLYGLDLRTSQWIPEVVKAYASVVAEADAQAADLARAVPSTAGSYAPLPVVGATNASDTTSTASGGSSGGGGGGSGRRLLWGPAAGGLCCSNDLTPSEVITCTGSNPLVPVEPMPYSMPAGTSWDRALCAAQDDWAERYALGRQTFGALSDVLVSTARQNPNDANLARKSAAAQNAVVCAQAMLEHMTAAQPRDATAWPARIRALLQSGNYSQMQIAPQQAWVQCVLAEPDARNLPADTEGIPCTPDLARPLQQPGRDALAPNAQVAGFYENIGPPCPCAPTGNQYYRSCTLNPWDAQGRLRAPAQIGHVQKCLFVPFSASDAAAQALLDQATGATTGAPTRTLAGQGVCAPYAQDAPPATVRTELTRSQTYSYEDCGQADNTGTKVLNAALGSGVAVFGKLVSGADWFCWPFPCSCPTTHATVDDNSYVATKAVAVSNKLVDDTTSLLALIGDQTKALEQTSAIVGKSNDIFVALRNMTAQNALIANAVTRTTTASLTNMRGVESAASDVRSRIVAAQTNVEANMAAVQRQINATQARLAQFRDSDAAFYAAMNQSLALQSALVQRQRQKVEFLASMQRRNRAALQDLSAAYSRITQGRDTLRRAMDALHQVLRVAQADGLRPFATPTPADVAAAVLGGAAANATMFGIPPRMPRANESNPVVDRTWVLFGSAAPPPWSNASATGATWLTQQQLELRCALGFVASTTRVNMTVSALKLLIGMDGCDPDASFDPFTPDGNNGDAPRPACQCVVRVEERACATAFASTAALAAALQDTRAHVYTEPIGAAFGCAPGPMQTRAFVLDSAQTLDAHLTDACARDAGGAMHVTQENGLALMAVPRWTRAANATVAVPGVTLGTFASPPIDAAGFAATPWSVAFLANASRTAADWCASDTRTMLLQAQFTGVQLLPQRVLAYWAYAFERFMASPFLREMDVALNGRPPRFGVAQTFRAYDTSPHPGDLVSLSVAQDMAATVAFAPNMTRAQVDAQLASAANGARSFARPYNCLEHRFVATGERMGPVQTTTRRAAVRHVTVEFVNTDGLVVEGGGGAAAANVSQADVDFLNAQLGSRTLAEDMSQSFAGVATAAAAVQSLTGYLSCAFDDAPCALPAESAASGTAAWYLYDPDATQLAAFARTLAQRAGDINYVRQRAPFSGADAPSVQQAGFNATHRRPMVSAQTFFFEEVVQAMDADAYMLLRERAVAASATREPNWDAFDLEHPLLAPLVHRALLSPSYRFDPSAAGANPDTLRITLVDTTDRAYETDPDARGVQTTTPRGAPNVITRRASGTQRAARGPARALLDAVNVVRDPRPWPQADAPPDRDPDRADTWRTLWYVADSEVVTVTVSIAQAHIDALFQTQTACPRDTDVYGATTAHPVVRLARPSPDQATHLVLRARTASGNQSCDAAPLHVRLPPAADAATAYDLLTLNLTRADTSCAELRALDLVRVWDDEGGRNATCFTWAMSGADARLPAGQDALLVAQSVVDTNAAAALQRVGNNMVNAIAALDALIADNLRNKLDVMTYAHTNGLTLAQAQNALPGGGSGDADLNSAYAAVLRALNSTTDAVTHADVSDADLDVLTAALRARINTTRSDELADQMQRASDLNAYVQALRAQDAQSVLLDADAYAAAVTQPVMRYEAIVSSDAYRALLAAAVAAGNVTVDWACMALMQEATARGVSFTSGLATRLANMERAVRRQDDACRPAWHNFWQLGVTNTPTSIVFEGMTAPPTTHYTGPFCSDAGRVLLEVLRVLAFALLAMLLLALLRAWLVACRNPASRLHWPAIVRTNAYQRVLRNAVYRRAVYTRFVGGASADEARAPLLSRGAAAGTLPGDARDTPDSDEDPDSRHARAADLNLFAGSTHPTTKQRRSVPAPLSPV